MNRRLLRKSLLFSRIVFATALLPTPAFAQQQPITLSAPLDYQVFQRLTRDRGYILVRGHLAAPADKIEARILDTPDTQPAHALPHKWHKLALNKISGEFEAALPTPPGGFYSVEVRALKRHATAAQVTVPHVGVGEVFLISGQSNSTNYGEVAQTTQTRMVTTFSGSAWRIADDPQPGTQDSSKKGSFAPSFGDAMFAHYHVPIAVASVGHGSTSVRQWLPAGEDVEVMPTMTRYVTKNPDGSITSTGALFIGMINRIHQLEASAPTFGHGFRAILWHQGESDSHQKPEHEIDGATYRRMLEHVILATREQAAWNVPWFVANASYGTPEIPSWPATREAQQALWHSGFALQGPDTDTLGPAYRQNNGKGVHFSDSGLKVHGQLWAQAIEAWLDHVLR
jgi:hypothetical protein